MMMSNQRTRSLFILLCLAYCLASVSCYRSATTTAGGKDYYGMMGLSKDCSATDIKKAYRRLALKHHPDKVASEEREQSEKKFKEIARAYEILSDDDKRQLYDQYGEAGIDPNFNPAFSSGNGMSGGPQQTFHFGGGPSFGGAGGAGGNEFESMFSGFGNSNGGMKIDLNEILRGFMEGQAGGGPAGGGYGPSPMGGFGGTRRSSTGSGGGPGMNFFSGASSAPPHQQQQQQQQYYSAAKEYTLPFSCTLEELATGCTKKLKVTHPTAAMDPMTGQPMIRERIYSVKVKPGWKKGTKIKFKATQDGFPPIAFTLNEKKHNHYRRINNDIIWKCVLSPNQAAKGVKLKVPLLTGNILELVVADNDEIPIQHQQRKIIKGKGMSIKGGPQHGDLIIEFYIKVKSG